MACRSAQSRIKKGFTIVELLIVIVVIGILAGIVILSFGAWHKNVIIKQVQSDLTAASAAMSSAKTFNGGYPTSVTLPINITSVETTFTPSSGDTLSLSTGSSATTFCIDEVSSSEPSIIYYIDDITNTPTVGTCASRTLTSAPTTPTNLSITSVSSSSIALSWSPSSYASSYNLECSTDAGMTINVLTATSTLATGTVNSLTSTSSYYCRVNAINSVGSSGWSAEVTATTNGTAYSNVLASGSSLTSTSNGIQMVSLNGQYSLGINNTGTIVEYYNGSLILQTPYTGPSGTYQMNMLGNGNLTATNSGGTVVFQTYTANVAILAGGSSGWGLTLANTGLVTISDGTNTIWNSTSGKIPPPCNYINSDTFKIVNYNSSKTIDVVSGSLSSGGAIDQYAYSGQPQDKWSVTYLGSNQYKIINGNSGLSLDDTNNSLSNGTAMQQWTYNATPNQLWQLIPLSGGYCKIQNVLSGLTLDVVSGSTANAAVIDQYAYSGQPQDSWIFQEP